MKGINMSSKEVEKSAMKNFMLRSSHLSNYDLDQLLKDL